MGSSWSRRDRIIKLAKLRGDKAALAIMGEAEREAIHARALRSIDRWVRTPEFTERYPWTESELRALWGDR
jgi:hypothetical protein